MIIDEKTDIAMGCIPADDIPNRVYARTLGVTPEGYSWFLPAEGFIPGICSVCAGDVWISPEQLRKLAELLEVRVMCIFDAVITAHRYGSFQEPVRADGLATFLVPDNG